MAIKGIDVSKHQPGFDWNTAKSKIDFAVVRSSHGMGDVDSEYVRNYAECKRLNIPLGVYHYFYYGDKQKHDAELQNFIKNIGGKSFELPVFLDYEENQEKYAPPLGARTKTELAAWIAEDVKKLNDAGFTQVGLYASKNWLMNKIDMTRVPSNIIVWLAHYTTQTDYNGRYEFWQYTSDGSIEGIANRLDVNYFVASPLLRSGTKGYAVSILQNKLNDFGLQIKADGAFGPQTDSAVKDFQERNGLTVDGIVGAATWKKLREDKVSYVKEYSLAKDGEKYLSKNFQVKEFKCKDGSDKILIDSRLVELLQKIRDHFGKPVNINSAYRTPTYNAKIGGAKDSQHMYGIAADIWLEGVTPKQVYDYADSIGVGGCGLYNTFTHVDVRSGRARWNG